MKSLTNRIARRRATIRCKMTGGKSPRISGKSAKSSGSSA